MNDILGIVIVACFAMMVTLTISIIAITSSKKIGNIQVDGMIPTGKQLCSMFDELMDHYLKEMPELMEKISDVMEKLD